MVRTSSPHPAFPDGRPVKIGRRFLVVPGGKSLDDGIEAAGDRIPIRLSRGQAFGSGLHETTVSCVEALEELPSARGKTVLDVGTGTGILSLAAVLLGARSAVALDIDADAAGTCRRNADMNRVSRQLRVFQGTLEALDPSLDFDLVMANIHGEIILRHVHRLAAHTRGGGYMILSGLDYSDNRPVRSVLSGEGMDVVAVRFLEDFVTQVWRRPPAAHPAGP